MPNQFASRPPHGGYPTPRYDEAPMRRRLTSQRLWGHPGAWVAHTAEKEMARAGVGSVGADGQSTLTGSEDS